MHESTGHVTFPRQKQREKERDSLSGIACGRSENSAEVSMWGRVTEHVTFQRRTIGFEVGGHPAYSRADAAGLVSPDGLLYPA